MVHFARNDGIAKQRCRKWGGVDGQNVLDWGGMTVTAEAWRRRGHNVAAMRAMAQRVLPKPVFDFADGAAEDERTLRRNEAGFADIAFLPKPLDGSPTRDLSVDLFGHHLKLPLMIGPTGLAGLFYPDGERCAARAAAAAGIGYTQSHASVCTIEEMGATGVTPRWMQIFIYNDRGLTREFIERAQAAGHHGLVLTTDNQITGNRERDVRNGFSIPPQFSLADRVAMISKAPWLMRMGPRLSKITFSNYVRPGETTNLVTMAGRISAFLDPSLSWADVDWIRKAWKGPFLLKGILHPAEAAEAVKRGVDGVIVSNHGGRQLDGAAASIDALPAVVAAVEGRIPVLIDGGIRRGTDVIKALALGARCCLIARPQLWGLTVGGEAGVAHVLDIFRREIDRDMGLLGASKIADLGPHLLSRYTN